MFENELDNFLEEYLQDIEFEKIETKEYIKGIFKEQLHGKNNLADKSLTLKYIKAKERYSFDEFKELGDWIFWIKTTYPEFLNGASDNFYNDLAKISYYKCHILLNRQWGLFEEISDRFEYFAKNIQIEDLSRNVFYKII